MKKLLIFLLAALPSFLQAQDSITLKNGKTEEGKIVKVESDILYFRFSAEPNKSVPIPLNAIETYRISDIPDVIPVPSKTRELYCRLKVLEPKGVRVDILIEKSKYQNLTGLDYDKTFNNVSDALNYLGVEQGWTLVGMGNSTRDILSYSYYVFKKTVVIRQ